MAIKLADTLAPMADFPAVEAKDVAFNDNKSLQEKYDNGELGGGTNITVDSAMSDTSTNPVQNKIIKEYVDSKSTNVSEIDRNAIIKKSDGLFVEDLSNKVNALNIAQKTVNSELDYCFVGFWNNTNSNVNVTCTRGAAIPFNTKFEGNLEFNSTNKAVKLKAGHRYKLHYQCKQTGATYTANHMERFYNETTSEWLKMTCNCDTEDETHTMEEIYVPTVDCEVSVRNCWCNQTSFLMRVNCINTDATGPGLRTIDCESAFIVTEIGREVTIDPVEYVDSTKGIEDTPVGEIIRTIGNETPKHYLMCDGSVYNIADYPHLAQYFKDTFGAINVFGGDGTTTFAVPELSEPSKLTKISPIMTSYTTPSPYVVTKSSVWSLQSDHAWRIFDGVKTGDELYTWISAADELNPWICIDLGTKTKITSFKLWLTTDKNKFPENFTLQGSNDGTNFANIKSFTNVLSMAQASDGEIEFNLDRIAEYRYYKIYVDTLHITAGATYVRIYEWEMFYQDPSYRNCIKAEPTYYMELNQAAYINQYCDVYSTDEKIVGKWIDGKPLYRKIFTFTNTSASYNFSTNLVSSDIDEIYINNNSYATYDPGAKQYLPVNAHHPDSTYSTGAILEKNSNIDILIRNGSDRVNMTYVVILEYTKTTDAPNSFDYGMIINQFAQEALVDVAVTDAEVDKCFE